MTDIICSDILPTGTWVMLSDSAHEDLALVVGTEAVMRVLCHLGVDIKTNPDGDYVLTRKYAVTHQHRGRLMMGLSEHDLQMVSPESAQGQRLLHNEMTREFLTALIGN